MVKNDLTAVFGTLATSIAITFIVSHFACYSAVGGLCS